MADEHQQFETLLQGILAADNQTRTQSEDAYEGIPATSRIPLLIDSMRNVNTPLEVRTMAAVLLRRLYTTTFEEFWPLFSLDVQNSIKEQMLLCIQQENQPAIRRKMCDCTAEFARNMLDEDGNNTWPDVLKFLFECASSPDAGLRESALNVFTVVPGVFGNQQAQYIDVIKRMLQHCLADQANQAVRFAAVKGTTAFLLANEKETQVLNHCKDLLPLLTTQISESAVKQEDDALLKCLCDMAETIPKFLRPQLETVITLCMIILGDNNMPDQWRQLALEVIVTLSETAPAMVRKYDKFLTQLVPLILSMMVDLEEDENWSISEEIEEEDSDSNTIVGESALDRLCCGLGGKTMLPHIIGKIPTMLSNPDWRQRHSALMAISACGEGCKTQMEAMLGNILDAILPFLQDPHPRVRYASCNVLGQLCTDFGPNFQKKYHDKVVSSLLMVMDDHQNPRVQAHAGAALVNFSEDCPKSILTPYLDPIINKLEQVLTTKLKELQEKGTKLVLEQIVTTLASVADAAEERFIRYYDRFMPCLKYIVQNAASQELRLLRGKTIECISLIGLAVGRDKFMSDCQEVMQLLVHTQTEETNLEADDRQMSYLISAWARMCKIMGKDFEQYLQFVMAPVLRAASIKPEVAIVDTDDMRDMVNDQDWKFVTLGDQQSFGIRTAGLEDKATACQMLVCYARELKDAFAAYAEQVVKIMVTHLKFYFHDGVRIAAAEALPYLLDCARIRGPEYIQNMWQYVCPELLKSIDTEPEPDVKSEHMHALAQCIEKMGKGCLNEQQVKELVRILDKTLKEHFERQTIREEQRKDEDYDEVVEESLLDEDDEDVYILMKVSDIMHALFGTHKADVLPIFEQLLPLFVRLLSPGRPWADRQWALCVFDDLIEHTGPHAFAYQQYFLEPLITYVCDKQAEVRQAAAYGVGVMAVYGGEPFTPACREAIPLLLKVISDPESRAVENLAPTENAISAVTKICKHNPAAVSVDELLPHWLGWLPVWEDTDEAAHIYNYLCDLIEMNHPLILGENNQNLPRILGVISEAVHREAIATDDDVAKRLACIVQQIQRNEELFGACVTQLSEHQQAALSSLLAPATS